MYLEGETYILFCNTIVELISLILVLASPAGIKDSDEFYTQILLTLN